MNKYLFLTILLVSVFLLAETEKSFYISQFLKAENIVDSVRVKKYVSKYSKLYNVLKNELDSSDDIYDQQEDILEYLQENYFLKYSNKSTFGQVVDRKNFNCLTSTILYSMLSKDLNHNVKLYLTPWHVYISVVDEKGKLVYIDLTDQEDGFDFDREIESTVEYLLKSKIITKDELEKKGTDAVYKEYSDDAVEISFPDLIPLMYYNISSIYYDDKEYKKAFNSIETAYISNSKLEVIKNRYLNIWQKYAEHLNEMSKYSELDSLFLRTFQLSQMSLDNKVKIFSSFSSYIGKSYLVRDELENFQILYDSSLYFFPIQSELFSATLQDLSILIKIKEISSLENLGKSSDAYLKSKELFIATKENSKVEDFYIAMSAKYIYELTRNGQFDDAIKIGDEILVTYPENKDIKDQYCRILLTKIGSNYAYYREYPEKAEPYLLKAYSLDSKNIYVKQSLSSIYHEKGMKLIRANKLHKAKKEIEKGLEINPDSYELKDDLKLINAQIGN